MREILIEKFAPKSSSLVDYLIYNSQNNELEVKYKGGKHKGKSRKYRNIVREQFDFVINSDSVGRALISMLKKRAEDEEDHSFWKKVQGLFTGY